MPDFIQQNSAALLGLLAAAYGVWKFWPSISSLGRFWPSAPSPSTRGEAFAALEVLRTHFAGNPRGMKAVQEAGAAFWEEPGA